jgi:hypothetical protein
VSCWAKEKCVQMLTKVLGRLLDDVLRHWIDLPTHHGGIHDTKMWYSRINERMH